MHIGATILFLVTIAVDAQTFSINLSQFGYKKILAGRYSEPAFASLSYVGNNTLFVTFPTDKYSGGEPFVDYTGIVLSKTGVLLGKIQTKGTLEDVLQRRVNVQPLSNILIEVGDDLRIYSTDLTSFRAIKLPLGTQLRVPPDRKAVVAISPESNKSMDFIIGINGVTSRVNHLDFDERAVRDDLLAVSNDASVAHAIRDSDGELSVHSWSRRWPAFQIGKHQEPMTFTKDDELLVSVVAETPFASTYLYLWKATGKLSKIHGSKAGFYTSAESSQDAARVLLTQTNVSFFGAMLGGFDCDDCGESYFYSVVDVPSAKVILKHRKRWNCTEALSPSGKELAELCDGVIRFYPVPQ
ncbi:MAG TPA: hypothetical protein VFE38_12855 [Edaphobacter sp.]|nr:hypothetical protein [Edaphobacter sp.]